MGRWCNVREKARERVERDERTEWSRLFIKCNFIDCLTPSFIVTSSYLIWLRVILESHSWKSFLKVILESHSWKSWRMRTARATLFVVNSVYDQSLFSLFSCLNLLTYEVCMYTHLVSSSEVVRSIFSIYHGSSASTASTALALILGYYNSLKSTLYTYSDSLLAPVVRDILFCHAWHV